MLKKSDKQKIILRTCPFNTSTYNLKELVTTSTDIKITKNGTLLNDTLVKLDLGTNVFYVNYSVNGFEESCEIRIARRNKHRVVLNTNGGSFIETQYVNNGESIDTSYVTPIRDRYTFLGWFDEYGNKVSLTSTPITKDRTFTARWNGPHTFVMPDKKTISYTTSSAALNIVWKDYDNAFKVRPSEVLCELKNTDTSICYTVKITENTSEFVDKAPESASISQGSGKWTVKITGLSEKYTFKANLLNNENYTQLQSGTALTCTLKNYDPQADDTSWLMTENGRFYDIAGNVIVLKGVVTFNPGWDNFSEYTSTAYLKRLQEEGANCVRITMMLGDRYYQNLEKRPELVTLIKGAIKRTTDLGMYCIVDWGVIMHNENSLPETGYLPKMQDDANGFFSLLSKENVNNPYIIYEICNEPTITTQNGWEDHIKVFEESVIKAIRDTGSRSVIIAAPNIHARRLSDDSAARGDDPIDRPINTDISHNVAYTYHCYAYTTTYDINYNAKDRVLYGWRFCDAVNNRLTLVITEFSPATASMAAQSTGGLDADFDEADKYLNVILENDVSYTLFRGISGLDHQKTSSQHMFIQGNVDSVNNGVWTYDMLSDSGKWFYDKTLNSDGFIEKAKFANQ